MIVSQVSTTPGGSLTSLTRQEVTDPIGPPATRIFRRTLYLRLPTGGQAESLDIDPAATLRATFRALDYDAKSVSIPALRATIASRPDGLLITLDSARRVTGITLPIARAGSGSKLEFYRLDGDTPSSEPTVTVTRQETVVIGTLSRSSAAGARSGRTPRAANLGTGIGIGLGLEIDSALNNTHIALVNTNAQFNVNFTDARFLIRLKNSSGSVVSLSTSDLLSVQIRSYPTNPRIGLAVPENPATPPDPATAAFFWRATGEVGNATPEAAGTVDAGAELAAELQRALGRLVERMLDSADAEAPPPLLPPHLDVALVLESDAPCAMNPPNSGVALHVACRGVRESFAEGQPKIVLRFPAGHQSDQGFALPVPAGIDPVQATLTFDASLPKDRPRDGATAVAAAELDPTTGVQVGSGRRIAQRIDLDAATCITSIGVATMSLSARTEASIELRADADGRPEGSILAAGKLPASGVGEAGWRVLRLEDSVIVSTAPHWLVMNAPSGELVWLTRAGPEGVTVLNDADRSVDAVVPGIGTLLDLRARPTTGHLGVAPFSLFLAEQEIALEQDADGRFVADIAAATQAAVASAPAGTIVSLPIRLRAIGQGSVTAYPPRLVYD